jgi:hypothetical protein
MHGRVDHRRGGANPRAVGVSIRTSTAEEREIFDGLQRLREFVVENLDREMHPEMFLIGVVAARLAIRQQQGERVTYETMAKEFIAFANECPTDSCH